MQDAFLVALERWPARRRCPTTRRRGSSPRRATARSTGSAPSAAGPAGACALEAELRALGGGEDERGARAREPDPRRAAAADLHRRAIRRWRRRRAWALTLRALGGLTTAEVARAFLVSEPAMAQRIVARQAEDRGRGHQATRSRATPTCPRGCAACSRRVYLVFNAGYGPPVRAGAVRGGDPARRALLVGADARRARGDRPARADAPAATRAATRAWTPTAGSCCCPTRTARAGTRDAIAEGERLVARGWRLGRLGPYLVQASIAVEHSRGSDWTRIVWLYDQLLRRLADADRGAQPRRRDRRARRPGGGPGG